MHRARLTSTKIKGLIVGLGVVLLAGTAAAGYKMTVGSSTVSVGTGYAAGGLSFARNSSGSVERVRCTSWNYTGGASINCSFTNISGQLASCYSYDPYIVAAVQSITTDSYLAVYWDTTTGKCTEIDVQKDSALPPAAP